MKAGIEINQLRIVPVGGLFYVRPLYFGKLLADGFLRNFLCLKRKFWERISKVSNVDGMRMQDSDLGCVIKLLVLAFSWRWTLKMTTCNKQISTKVIHFIVCLRQVHSLFQNEFSTECDLIFSLSVFSIDSFP